MPEMKKIYVKGEDAVNWWLRKFHSGYLNLDDQERSDGPKTVDSEAVLQANQISNTKRVSGKLKITVQCGFSLSRPRQKHLELLNCAPRY